MIRNYLKFAFRFLTRHKSYTLINLSGLTLGLASFLLILNYVQQEMSYDSFYDQPENIYRVNIQSQGETETRKASAVSPPMGPALKAELPEVESSVRLRHANNVLVRIGEEHFYEDRVFYVDSTFFDVFSFPLILGDPNTALDDKHSAIISEELAKKYFADNDPLGQTLSIDDDLKVRITGVMESTPEKSHLNLALLISFSSFQVPHGYPVTLDSWGWTSFPTYVRLHDGSEAAALTSKLHQFLATHMGKETAERVSLFLQPVKDIHLKSKDIIERDGTAPKGDITYTYGLLAVAFLILGIAVFNFANLSTTLSLKRVREIGVRKTLGARRVSVFLQHLTESMLLSFSSFVIAVTLLEVLSAPLSGFLQVDLKIPASSHFENVVWYTALITGVGLAGGLYPSTFLSGYSPTKALKGRLTVKASGFDLKSVLIVFQFFITIGLIAATLVVNRQMNFMGKRGLGFDHQQVLAVQMVGEELHQRYSATRLQLLQNPNVEAVTAAGNLFDGQNGSVPIQEQGDDESRARISLFGIHYGFGELMELDFIAGRDFSEAYPNDSSHFILNESAVKMFGWDDDPIGKQLVLNDTWNGEVIGVVKDFHYASLHEAITPLVLYIPRAYQEYIFMKVNAGDISKVLASIEKDWKKINPDMPFDYRFIDDHINQLYKSDRQFTTLISSFSVLAIFLACMGLYGMVSFSVKARFKEIGIRKVLGASAKQMVGLLSSKFLLMIIIAAFFALPVSWYLLQKWLFNFAYHISMGWIQFALALLLTFLLAAITISLQTVRAAMGNPVEALNED
ncbi:ABC transporter permease [Fulvivirga kasyanovii]|uniref:FtsX-like permease family protein n=1 Tax=Fulvivirga kasyanovii TaxID=396812 RepID=A0ABW9RQR7_9BACT|nr:ABC transporter permease [Fulvivirga kasyanovii]MTI26519.1 FtsX-like permease family protein [Fulvivirga kasyanovii]